MPRGVTTLPRIVRKECISHLQFPCVEPLLLRQSRLHNSKVVSKSFSRMASSAKSPVVPAGDLQSFSEYLQGCDRIMALLGAGLSASSGLPTFRGAGGLWRSHDAISLATPEAFNADPGLVWQFYSYRRHMALQAQPNRAHLALAELARRKSNFITLSQNVDGDGPEPYSL